MAKLPPPSLVEPGCRLAPAVAASFEWQHAAGAGACLQEEQYMPAIGGIKSSVRKRITRKIQRAAERRLKEMYLRARAVEGLLLAKRKCSPLSRVIHDGPAKVRSIRHAEFDDGKKFSASRAHPLIK